MYNLNLFSYVFCLVYVFYVSTGVLLWYFKFDEMYNKLYRFIRNDIVSPLFYCYGVLAAVSIILDSVYGLGDTKHGFCVMVSSSIIGLSVLISVFNFIMFLINLRDKIPQR